MVLSDEVTATATTVTNTIIKQRRKSDLKHLGGHLLPFFLLSQLFSCVAKGRKPFSLNFNARSMINSY